VICVRNLERRIADLERSLKRSSVYAESDDSHREFIAAVLRAIAHVRRAPIDPPPQAYSIDKLHTLEPFDCATYVAALAVNEHPDEEEARDILKVKGEDPGLLGLIDVVVGHSFRELR
jgi:hypothetical protein